MSTPTLPPSQLNPFATSQMTTHLKTRRQAFMHRVVNHRPSEDTAMNKTTLTRKKTQEQTTQPTTELKKDQPDLQENTTMTAQVKEPKDQQPSEFTADHPTPSTSEPTATSKPEPMNTKALAQAIIQQALIHYHQANRPKEPTPSHQETVTAECPTQRYSVRMRRLTIELPESLHRDIKVYSAQKDLQVGLLVRSILHSCFAPHADQQ